MANKCVIATDLRDINEYARLAKRQGLTIEYHGPRAIVIL